MKNVRKWLSVVLCVLLLFGTMAAAVSAEEAEAPVKVTLSPKMINDPGDGFYLNPNITCKPDKDKMGFTLELIDYDAQLWDNIGWVISADRLEKYPYLFLNLPEATGPQDEGMAFSLVFWWLDNPDAGVSYYYSYERVNAFPGNVMVDLPGVIERDIGGYRGANFMIALYIGLKPDDPVSYRGPVHFNEAYLCSQPVPVEGYGEEPPEPTQPAVPDGQAGHMLRYELPAFAQDTTEVAGKPGFSWLMGAGAQAVPGEGGKGFTMRRAADAQENMVNIAWVVPYEQLAQTPYLVIDIGNYGRMDEGPRVQIYSYWEHVNGSYALFDGIKNRSVPANELSGINAFNLKYAVDNVREELHGTDGIAIIVALDLNDARIDGTVLEDLTVSEAYLMGWEPGYEGTGLFSEMDAPGALTQPTAAGSGGEAGFPWVPVLIGAGAVIVVAVVAILYLRRKK